MIKKTIILISFLLMCGASMAQTPLSGRKSDWNGYQRYDFKVADRDAILVEPKTPLQGSPWIWRPAFFNAFPSADIALLKEGFHVAYYDLTHLYGSPRAMTLGNGFYDFMTKEQKLSPKVTLEGFSRGGAFAINWASENPDKVACIYLDAPVCNFYSWPSPDNKELWNDLLKEWELTSKPSSLLTNNPMDRLKPIAQAAIPILAVCGDSDKTVPYEQNMNIVRSRLLALGGSVEVILKPGVDHHPHSLENPEPIVEFILRNQPEYQTHQYITFRGNLGNAFWKFENKHVGRVAFLGGSITEMRGWHNRVMDELKQRFPFTDFEFIEAGISSTGSTPGAFRLEHDVLSHGEVDLLFVEAAVNDDTNHFTPEEQVRGMEGIIRHALLSNPQMDIMIFYFVYDPFIDTYRSGRIPDVILNHERVANHYLIPSINLSREIFDRMERGEFTWEQFGGTHPSWFGHRFYAAAIERVFDKMSAATIQIKEETIAHKIPEIPLDAYSYWCGDFLEIQKAQLGDGWKLVPEWKPAREAGTRNNFVHVPMLEATQPGSTLTLDFEGTAIGIFCVCGPAAATMEYSVDGVAYPLKDTYTEWSNYLYLPWVYTLATKLAPGKHTLKLSIASDKNPQAEDGYELQIRNFVVNQ